MLARHLVSRRPGQLALEEHDVPAQPPPGGIIARAAATAISPGTEVTMYLGRAVLRPADSTEPYYPGYSFAGVVVAAGEGAGFKPGDRVCGPLPHASLAAESRPERLARLTVIPDGVSDPAAAMTQLGCIALNAVRLARLQLGDSVAVLGAGLVGLLACRFAHLSGARPVLAADPVASRRELARVFGASASADPAELAARSGNGVPQTGFDVVFEASGTPQGVLQAMRLAARGGRVVLLGSTRGLVDGFDPYDDVHRKGVTVIGAHVSTAPAAATLADRWTEAANRRYLLGLLRDRVVEVSPLITDTIAPRDAGAMFADLARAPGGRLGVIIDWEAAG
ncbi:MAG TPA: zinc-binding alcohol dehydrogenase [Streptosporangiaceae bacterium]|nr:zinc-binding alcohol dehydrogenase [Streptosporangiaceae bacterium]